MDTESVPHLRVLVSDGPGVRLDEVTSAVAGLGHDVTAKESLTSGVGDITPVERPDVALVIVHEGSVDDLQVIDQMVHHSHLMVIIALVVAGAGVYGVAKRGCFAAYTADAMILRRCRAPSVSLHAVCRIPRSGGAFDEERC
jgi:hypothetical protein